VFPVARAARSCGPCGDAGNNPCRRQGDQVVAPGSTGRRLLVEDVAKVPDHDDDPGNIAATQQYLRDFNRLDETTATSRELFDAMMELHPDRANPGSLW